MAIALSAWCLQEKDYSIHKKLTVPSNQKSHQKNTSYNFIILCTKYISVIVNARGRIYLLRKVFTFFFAQENSINKLYSRNEVLDL